MREGVPHPLGEHHRYHHLIQGAGRVATQSPMLLIANTPTYTAVRVIIHPYIHSCLFGGHLSPFVGLSISGFGSAREEAGLDSGRQNALEPFERYLNEHDVYTSRLRSGTLRARECLWHGCSPVPNAPGSIPGISLVSSPSLAW